MQTETETGTEFWLARDLQTLLGYSQWKNFSQVIDKAKTACSQSGYDVADHFADVGKMVDLGSGAQREIDDVMLSRYACYLIAQNGDPTKEPVAFAQTYFAVQTRKMEVIEQRLAEMERLGGWGYLTPAEAAARRGGVLLESVLIMQLRKLNRIRFKRQEYEFSEASIQFAVQALTDVVYDELIRLRRRQLDALKTQKKGLMQKLLTGQARVKHPVSGLPIGDCPTARETNRPQEKSPTTCGTNCRGQSPGTDDQSSLGPQRADVVEGLTSYFSRGLGRLMLQ